MNILSLNGGGMAAYLEAAFIAKLEEHAKLPSAALFDRIYGVSAGAIVGGGLAQGYPAKELKEIIKENGHSIFGKKRWWALWSSWYKASALEKMYEQVYGSATLGTLQTEFCTYAVKISGEQITTKFWKSWEDPGMLLKSVVRASSAAPVYFDPLLLDGEVYIDGGMYSSNPTISAIVDAIKDGKILPEMFALNVQVGFEKGVKSPAKKKGLVRWITDIYTVCNNSVDRATEYEAHQLLGFNNHVVRPAYYPGMVCLDFDEMDRLVDAMWAEHGLALVKRFT